MSTADWYLQFAAHAADAGSPGYDRLSRAVAADLPTLALLDQLPAPKRQPNLLFAATRYLGGPVGEPAQFLDWVRRHWAELVPVISRRRTQTNEPGRCASLLPLLAALPQPLALLEVGPSAGLCLYPDAYRYRYGRHTVGPADSPVELHCDPSGPVPLPQRVPTVVWRAGLDLNPLDVADDDDLRWLAALIWPEHRHRAARLRPAAAIVRADPPRLVRGDLLADLPALAATAPAGATLVVFHTAVLSYVSPSTVDAFADLVGRLPGHWIANESPDALPAGVVPAGLPLTPATMLLALDGHPVALGSPHGDWLRWLPGTHPTVAPPTHPSAAPTGPRPPDEPSPPVGDGVAAP